MQDAKFIKKELQAIPLELYPAHAVPAKDAQLVMTAKRSNYRGQKLLVATFYDVKSRKPHLRIFSGRTRWMNWYITADKWDAQRLDYLGAPHRGQYSTMRIVNVTTVADEKSSKEGASYYHNGKKNTLEAIDAFQSGIAWKKQMKRIHERAATRERLLPRFPPLREGLAGEIEEGPMHWSRYLFYWSEPHRTGSYMGYCTRCRQTVCIDWHPEHKGHGRCPHCGAAVETRKQGLSRKYMIDKQTVMVFDKDTAGAVYIHYLTAARDYSGDFRTVTTELYERERYYFGADGAAVKFKLEPCYGSNGWHRAWETKVCVTEPEMDGAMYDRGRNYCILPFAADFLNDTVLRHAQFITFLELEARRASEREQKHGKWHITWNGVPITYLMRYWKYPQAEHLVTAGLYPLLREDLRSYATARGAINWKGTRPRDLLGLTGPQTERFVASGLGGAALLLLRGLLPQIGNDFTAQDLELIAELNRMQKQDDVRKLIAAGTAGAYIRYLHRQHRRGMTYGNAIQSLQDYHAECRRLDYDLANPQTHYPHDLKKAHDCTMKLVREQERIKAELAKEKERMAFEERLAYLEQYAFVDMNAGLTIRAAQSSQELVHEGAQLHHCVGGYAQNHLAGKTTIFFIRRADAPDEPYFTLEYRDNRMIQNRGLRNCAPPPEVTAFAEKWLNEIAAPIQSKELAAAKKRKKKPPAEQIRIQVPA